MITTSRLLSIGILLRIEQPKPYHQMRALLSPSLLRRLTPAFVFQLFSSLVMLTADQARFVQQKSETKFLQAN